MKIKIAFAALLSVLLISASSTITSSSTASSTSLLLSLSSKTLLLSQEVEFQIQTEKQKAAISDILTISYALADFITDPPDDFNKDLVYWTGSWIRAPADAIDMITRMER